MDYLYNFLTNPITGITLSLIFSLLVARYTYKINSFTKSRLKKQFYRRLSQLHTVLLDRRDAFFARFILRSSMMILFAVLIACNYIIGTLIKFNSDEFDGGFISPEAMQWFLIVFVAFLGIAHFRTLFRLMRETNILNLPRYEIDKLRKELLSEDTRELLGEDDVKTLANLLDMVEAELPGLYVPHKKAGSESFEG
ncbi:hypothetical protein [Sinorhizobium meliloti]|uniref:hypothetical protein n=1 Tax=Rhizobium meliloti TaxID=382 RepID=UPI000FD74CCE|nr:hypothetical protein [Sinorhizobium meliloti]RVP24586.1 hypothetical protein CN080_09980 [Sinorhizobium meliloti]RVP24668.1 hypothetical protein CN080_10420 [Sinorhizobium meliloti]